MNKKHFAIIQHVMMGQRMPQHIIVTAHWNSPVLNKLTALSMPKNTSHAHSAKNRIKKTSSHQLLNAIAISSFLEGELRTVARGSKPKLQVRIPDPEFAKKILLQRLSLVNRA